MHSDLITKGEHECFINIQKLIHIVRLYFVKYQLCVWDGNALHFDYAKLKLMFYSKLSEANFDSMEFMIFYLN